MGSEPLLTYKTVHTCLSDYAIFSVWSFLAEFSLLRMGGERTGCGNLGILTSCLWNKHCPDVHLMVESLRVGSERPVVSKKGVTLLATFWTTICDADSNVLSPQCFIYSGWKDTVATKGRRSGALWNLRTKITFLYIQFVVLHEVTLSQFSETFFRGWKDMLWRTQSENFEDRELEAAHG